ncbi:MAG: L,D-transpeptidase [Herbinix sp.]|nr:L,D-transpeptidase [Herbinix sp.]
MKAMIKRFLGLRLLLIMLGFSVLLITTGNHQASAEVQKKNIYLIKVNRVYNTITVYEQDDKGEYTVPVRAMLCSVGANGKTKTGTFQTKAKYRWKLLMGNVWGQYSTRIVDGILFHSVYYYEKGNPATLATKEFNKLGTAASHGCIRLAVKDAKWIYDNCKVGTTVVIYDDKESPGPLGKPEAIKIASNIRWDPTDTDINNPYNMGQPVIVGAKNIKISWNEKIDLLKGLTAKSSSETDITSEITAMPFSHIN